VDRENAQRYVVIQSNVRDRDLVGFVEDAKAAVARDVKLPEGYRLAWGGQFENQQRAAARLMSWWPVALAADLLPALLHLRLGAPGPAGPVQHSLRHDRRHLRPLALSGEYLSVPASVGFIALLGIAVLNGVVMVTYFNQLLARGMPVAEVVVEAPKRRLRPVLMTASIAAFGLVPMLFATGPGSEVQRPLAIVVIGGLLTRPP
jgi:cobalt-zinc-cadmium resistance protein CzcA